MESISRTLNTFGLKDYERIFMKIENLSIEHVTVTFFYEENNLERIISGIHNSSYILPTKEIPYS